MKFILNPVPAIVIAASLSFACTVFADNAATPETAVDEEDELGINITKSGYDKLKQTFDWKNETQRTDYYFDAFDGKSFVLLHLPTPHKLRLKDKENGLFLQFSHPTQRETITVKGVPVYVMRTKSDQIQCNQSFGPQLKSISNKFFANLDIGGAKLLSVGEEFNQAWCANENEISTKVKSALATKSAKIVPTQENTKGRVTLKRELAGVKFKLFLEDKRARDSHGAWVHEYGLEAEPRSSYTHKDLLDAAAALGELGAKNGLGTADLRSANPDATEYTLKQLAQKKGKN
ncbi:MAG: hypothetical protein K2X81_03775 [Candidatus Obscuribacterales bacterium]|nr:hypothetical protein [Candidatus Obscuribacterales bacterium]